MGSSFLATYLKIKKRYIQFSVWNFIGLNYIFQICWKELKNVPQEQNSSRTHTLTFICYINNLKVECNRNDHDLGKVLDLAVH